MKQVLIRKGTVRVEEVPAPMAEPGNVVVRVDHSCISVGTELSGLQADRVPLWRRALRNPELVRKGLALVASQGVARTRELVRGALEAGAPTGYSAAGTVIEVGEGACGDFRPGDRVACAGAQCAFHAEVIRVPRNLVVRVPDGLEFPDASTVTLGAIALQGVRRANPTLGECFLVLGLGVLGQLTAQLLKANGCRVIGADPDPARVRLALDLGMDGALNDLAGEPVDQVMRLTGGLGADGAIVTASTPSHAVVSTAFHACRRKARVIVVGDVGLNLCRADFYRKEIDLLISTSYGPGRYDERYEEKGLDYPVAYVRWTENRNMVAYLQLLAEGRLTVQPLVGGIFTIAEAPAAYATLQKSDRPLMVLLSYPGGEGEALRRSVPNPRAERAATRTVRIAVVGAGGFAKGTHLPNLQHMRDSYHLRAVVSRTGHNALAAARQHGADYASTEYRQVLEDPEVDAVLIATRHDRHASMTLEALRAGKHVLVEKPLALSRGELGALVAFFDNHSAGTGPLLLTGFNRRFSPYARRMGELLKSRRHPFVASYRMNAGYIPPDHWVQTEEGGGRNLGEACHVYDLFTFLTDARIQSVQAAAIAPSEGPYGPRDNFSATLSFDDGSVASLLYTAMGAGGHPKEQLEVFTEGRVLVLDDYRRLTVAGAKVGGTETKLPDKGHRAELEAFADAILSGGQWPIPLWQQVQATEIALAVEDQIAS
ncbi:MAG: bi-domain-containing oxidoreductase [Deferrisomatales bacterium]|nr:bi-domain-containing oxidoreductase [Deferrisomatales bacterium]